MLGIDLYNKVIDQIRRAVRVGDKNPNANSFVRAVMAARAKVPAKTFAGHVDEETIAYLVESPENHNLLLVRRIFAAIRAFLFRLGLLNKDLTTDDLVALAKAAVHRASREQTVYRDIGSLKTVTSQSGAVNQHPAPHQGSYDLSEIHEAAGYTSPIEQDAQPDSPATTSLDFIIDQIAQFSQTPGAVDPFSPDPTEAETFRNQLDQALTSLKTLVRPITVGTTPQVLQQLGAHKLPVTISRDVVRKAINAV